MVNVKVGHVRGAIKAFFLHLHVELIPPALRAHLHGFCIGHLIVLGEEKQGCGTHWVCEKQLGSCDVNVGCVPGREQQIQLDR